MSSTWRVEQLTTVDQRLFVAPYVLIDADNSSPQRVATRGQATAAVQSGAAAAVAGQLRGQVLTADVDPADAGADAEAGEAVADDLVLWAESYGLPWLVRASGRPGGRHVFIVTAAESIAADLAGPWRQLCAELGARHGAATSPRTSLRLLSSPHRHGRESPVLGGTVMLEDLPELAVETAARGADESSAARPRRRRARQPRKQSGVDRSAREYGEALARARAGWDAREAWSAADVAGAKAREMGERDWRRWVWAPATTVVAAEVDLTEEEAWQRFQRASPPRARQLGRDGWHSTYWQPALTEAVQDRPRRRRTGSTSEQSADPEQEAEIAAVSQGLLEAAEQELTRCGRRAQFRRSVTAVLQAFAPALVRRGGALAERSWCEAASIVRSTLQGVVAWLVERGILTRVQSAQDSTTGTAVWQPAPVVATAIEQVRKTRSTRGVHPTTRTHGRADSTRMVRRHARERRVFRLRKELSANTKTSEQTYKTSTHPAAKVLRSIWFQKRWWHSKTTDEQEQRRQQRRERLTAMHRSERATWLSWLQHRDDLVLAAARTDVGHSTADDHHELSRAPTVVHRGLADPEWRDWHRTTRLPSTSKESAQMPLLAAA